MRDRHRVKVLKAFLKQFNIRVQIQTQYVSEDGVQQQCINLCHTDSHHIWRYLISETYPISMSPIDVLFEKYAGKYIRYSYTNEFVFLFPGSYEEMEMLVAIYGDMT